jgi:hypothetical protein
MASNKYMKYAKQRKIKLPDQSVKQDYSIIFDYCVFNSATGKRDKVLERKEVKFASAEDMADYYEQNCHHSKVNDFYPKQEIKDVSSR